MSKTKLFLLTRRIGFIWKAALGLGLSVMLVGAAISLANRPQTSPVEQMLASIFDRVESDLPVDMGYDAVVSMAANEALRGCLEGGQPFPDKLEAIQQIHIFAFDAAALSFPEMGAAAALSSNEYAIASAFLLACSEAERFEETDGDAFEADESVVRLKSYAAEPVPFAHFALALLYRPRDLNAAEQHLLEEINLYGEAAMRERLVEFYLDSEKTEKLEALADDPAFRPWIGSHVLQEIALAKMDWPMLVKTLIPAAYEDVNPALVVLTLVSGLAWAVVLLRFNGSLSFRAAPVCWALPALLLGALSAHATILFIFWQEHQLNLGMDTDLLGQLAYCLGIGFREEGIKLVFFALLLPFLRKMDDLEILTVAGLVGLGFAAEENVNYFEASAGLSALARFSTANFLHISLTAMGGLTLARAVFNRQASDIQQALTTFVSIVLFHGLYDALLIVDVLADYAWLSFTVFIVLSKQYFDWLRYLREKWNDPVSITLVFTLGLVLVTGLSYGFHAWQVGAFAAFNAIAGEFLGIAVILFMFYREIPETLHH